MAEINNGTLSFKSILDNGQLNAAIDETLRRVQGFSNAVAGSGDVMDKTTQEIVECIEIQRKVIQGLEDSYNDLTAKINAIEPGEAQNQLIVEANEVKKELDAEKQGLVELIDGFNFFLIIEIWFREIGCGFRKTGRISIGVCDTLTTA